MFILDILDKRTLKKNVYDEVTQSLGSSLGKAQSLYLFTTFHKWFVCKNKKRSLTIEVNTGCYNTDLFTDIRLVSTPLLCSF